jgi:ketosteroid isomerase-like protein
MSEESVELARQAFAAASRGGVLDALDQDALERAFEFFDPEIEIREDPRFPEAGVYRGRDAAWSYFNQFVEQFDEFRFELEDVLDAGDERVVLLLRLHGRGKGSGAVFEARPGWIQTLRGSKVVRIEAYLDRGEALEALGLAERASEAGPG